MFDLYLVVDLVIVLALSVLSLAILLKNKTAELNRIFALFVTCTSVWIIANYISNDLDNTPRTAVIANYFVFFFSYNVAVYLLRFTNTLASDTEARRIFNKWRLPMFLIGATGATPLVVAGAQVQGKVYAVHFGPLAPLYFITLITIVALSVYVTYRNMRRSRGDQKARLRVLFNSFCWTFPGLILMQAILPAVTGWFGLTNIGIMPMLILVFGLYYGVVKHRLFDLRWVIVRALVYTLTLGSLSVFYGITSYYITRLIASFNNILLVDLLNVVVIIIIASAYAPVRKGFNKFTNKFFYQDAYDSEVFLDNLNKVLVNTAEIRPLLRISAEIIEQNLKSNFCVFALKESGSSKNPLIAGSTNNQSFDIDLNLLISLTSKLNTKIINVDYLPPHSEKLHRTFEDYSIAILARLVSETSRSVEGSGFLIIGSKKSGNPYNQQDLAILEIIVNELVIAIQNALRFEEIQGFAATLQAKVNEATAELKAANQKLKDLDASKDEFISMASHQLRTPLTSVKGYLSMVLEGDAGKLSAMQRKLLTQSFNSSQRMVYLIADLLNVSRLKTGKFVVEASLTNLAEVVEGEITQLQETASGRGLTLSYDKPASFPDLMLDETKIRQVIMNFIDNAIYYTPKGGHIVVKLEDKTDSIEFTVTDDGMGVPKPEQHELFNKFYRAGNARKARPDGTGLGLFMAKKVIIAQGGGIIFTSQEGKGSTFGFTFAKPKLKLPGAN